MHKKSSVEVFIGYNQLICC